MIAPGDGPATPPPVLPAASFRLDRLYAVQQSCVQTAPEEGDDDERSLGFGWDWRILGPRTFGVAFSVNVGPSRSVMERVFVQMAGEFTLVADSALAFADFVRVSAPALLRAEHRERLWNRHT
jgi:hypothetical protein